MKYLSSFSFGRYIYYSFVEEQILLVVVIQRIKFIEAGFDEGICKFLVASLITVFAYSIGRLKQIQISFKI